MEEVVIVSGVRTPIGRYGGTLREVPVYKFTSIVLNETIKRAGVEPAWVDDVIPRDMRLVTLFHEMRRRGCRYGLEAVCGGEGASVRSWNWQRDKLVRTEGL